MRLQTSRAMMIVSVVIGLGSLSTGDEKGTLPNKANEQRTVHTVEASIGYPTNAGIGIQAEKQPGEFTIPKGSKGTKLKYNFHDPKSDYSSTKLNGRNIYSVTEHRYMDELDKNPDFELPPGDYKFVVGGKPGASGTLTYTTVPSSDTKPPAKPPEEYSLGPDWLYIGVWLPEKYLPTGYRHYPEDTIPSGDPPQGNSSQSLWYGIPLQRKGGKASPSSGDHPYTVFIDGVSVYKSTALARKNFQVAKEGPPTKTTVALGEEAYIDDNCKDADSLFKEYRGSDGEIFRRDLNVRSIRVGRVVFGLRVDGDRVEDFNPNGTNHDRFVAHETPSREDVMRVAELIVSRVREYAKDKGWLEDGARD